MRLPTFCLAGLLLFCSACIGDDVIDDRVPAEVRITHAVDTLALGANHTFQATFLNELGLEESRPITWSSGQPDVIAITPDGTATALAVGQSEISAEATLGDNSVVRATQLVTVGESTSAGPTTRAGALRTTSSYLLEGDFAISAPAGGLVIELADNYRASTALPGLYLYLSNNPNSTNGALEIGAVAVFAGAHSYTVPDVGIDQYAYLLYYCKPFNVKVGDGEIN